MPYVGYKLIPATVKFRFRPLLLAGAAQQCKRSFATICHTVTKPFNRHSSTMLHNVTQLMTWYTNTVEHTDAPVDFSIYHLEIQRQVNELSFYDFTQVFSLVT
jgi:hypothetical protein